MSIFVDAGKRFELNCFAILLKMKMEIFFATR